MSWHQTIIVGNLGGDPEQRFLPSGTAVCNFTVAVNETWTDRQSNEKREKTTWYRVAFFGKQAETAGKYLRKGQQIMVIGNVEASAYMGNDGQPKVSLELKGREFRFLQGGDNLTEPAQAPPATSPDIPF